LYVPLALSTQQGVHVPLKETVYYVFGGNFSVLGQVRGSILSEIVDVKLGVLKTRVKFALEKEHGKNGLVVC
jgi:hypothetical protein